MLHHFRSRVSFAVHWGKNCLCIKLLGIHRCHWCFSERCMIVNISVVKGEKELPRSL